MTTQASEIITSIRSSRELSTKALADLAGVPTSTISRIEAGLVEPTIAMLMRIANSVGYSAELMLSDSGSDASYTNFLTQLEAADTKKKARLIRRMPTVAELSPVTKRLGLRRVELSDNLESTIAMLAQQGQSPTISSLEAYVQDYKEKRSFYPVIYVEEPLSVSGLNNATKTSPSICFLLPATDGVKSWERTVDGVGMVSKEWGLLDALASPGRQADVAMTLVDVLQKEQVCLAN